MRRKIVCHDRFGRNPTPLSEFDTDASDGNFEPPYNRTVVDRRYAFRERIVLHCATAAALAFALAACARTSNPTTPTTRSNSTTSSSGEAKLVKRFDGLDRPLLVVAPPAAAGPDAPPDRRLFIVEQPGTVRVANGDELDPTPWLDLRDDLTSDGGEQGLLGMAFHPAFATNGKVYVDYTARGSGASGDTKIDELVVDPDAAGPAQVKSRRTVLTIPQPYSNHNGGDIVFGPDGRLWIGTGDGGSANDPDNRAQNPRSLLGKMLRLDVDTPGSQPEIWADGLRNPWRFSFDAPTGDLWIGDVGQNAVEEIDVVRDAAAQPVGGDFGWPITEGDRRNRDVAPTQSVAPVATYRHDDGNCSVTGGVVHRGPPISVAGVGDLRGRYVYGDYCSGRIWAIEAGRVGAPVELTSRIGASGLAITSFGVDSAGRLHVVDGKGEGDGSVWVLEGAGA